jgi:hypothetical protein
MLPFFSQNASTGKQAFLSGSQHLEKLICVSVGNKAWPLVLQDLQFFIDNGKGKKMYFDEVTATFLRGSERHSF